MIEIQINGKSKQFDSDITITELLQKMEIAKEGTAIAVNSSVVPRSSHPSFKISDGDKLEIIRAVGGG